VASGRLGTPVPRSAVREVDRIAVAFERCRSTLDGTPESTSRPRMGVPAVVVVALAALAALGWAVAVLVSVGGDGGELGRNGMVVGLIGILFTLLLFGWQYLLLIRPLRRLAAAADELVAGHPTVIYPQHQDQIGTIASCLEICRQALTDGIHRLGTVRRPSGAATEDTGLLYAVRATSG
jgi:HAMP domain-containing protein